jgi:dTDP-4-amino-4,6-dideoxygalactose transaminase
VAEFERAFAERVGAREAVATTSCTTALALALLASGVGPGDEVVVPSMSFIATANAVWHCGAEPVFADIEPLTYNLSPQDAERAITPRTKAIMPVHQIGLPADMDAFAALGRAHDVAIVEDAACAIGASYRGAPIGSLQSPACFSLHPRKVITTGEGGMITVADPALAERMRRLRGHGMDMSDLARHDSRGVVIESYPERGFNMRMTDMQAAIGLCQLRVLDEVLERRRAIAERYNAAFEDVAGLLIPHEPTYAQRTWQSYCLRLTPASAVGRTELMERLQQDGIATRRGVMAIHRELSYAGSHAARHRIEAAVPPSEAAALPHTEAATAETLMLPLFPDLSKAEQNRVITRVLAHAVRTPARSARRAA